MRVLHITKYFYPIIGGAENHVLFLSKRLLINGIETHVLTRKIPGRSNFEVIEGIHVHRSPLKTMPITLVKFYKENFDVIHIHGYRSPTSFLSYISIPLLWRRNCVVTLHGIYPYKSKIDKIIKLTYDQTVARVGLARSEKVIALSEIDRLRIAKLAGTPLTKIEVIPNAIEFDLFNNLPEKGGLKACGAYQERLFCMLVE